MFEAPNSHENYTKSVSKDFEKWIKILNSIISELENLNSQSEKDFLTIGQGLIEYRKKSSEVVEFSNEIKDLIIGDKIKGKVLKLIDLSKKLENFTQSVDVGNTTNIDSLNKISTILNETTENLSGFNKIVKSLKMLSISTHIESARLGSNDSGFTTLASDVEKLSEDIDLKTKDIIQRSETLEGFIKNTIYESQKLESQQENQTAEIINKINYSLLQIEKKNTLCATSSKGISANSTKIVEDINQIVTLIQFHDITRQQIEHVIKSVSRIADGLLEIKENEQSNEETYYKNIAAVRDIGKLEAAQLTNSKDEFYSAMEDILIRLNEIENCTSDIMQEVVALAECGSGTNKESNYFEETFENLSSIANLLEKNNEINNRLTNSIKEVTDTVSELAEYVNMIEDIGEEVELISLNASIKAAHTGKEGAALGVIADSIQKLAAEALSQTKNTSEPLLLINSLANELNSKREEQQKEKKEKLDLELIINEMHNLVKEVSEVNTNLNSMLNKLNADVSYLQTSIKILTKNTRVHNRVENLINTITLSLNDLVEEARNIIGDKYAELNSEEINELAQRYTMLAERDIHKTLQTHIGLDSETDSILFDEEHQESNVEFF